MKLVNFLYEGQIKLGVQTNEGILDLEKTGLNLTMDALIEEGEEGLGRVIDCLKVTHKPEDYYPEVSLTYCPVVAQPEKILCIGLNYASHTDECQMELPKYPVVFSKFNNALAAHGAEIELPKNAEQFDYEAELVLVIGKTAKNVTKEEALDYVFGYTLGNDLSARDLQFKTPQWLIGKTCDQFAPVGPFLVTKDQIDPNHLQISCRVNGQLKQNANTKDMIFSCADIVHYLSQQMTLKPGDLIFTGTPSGVVLGYPKDQQVWLKKGDTVVVEIEGIGKLENHLV